MVTGMTIATTIASRQPMAKPDQRDDRHRGEAEMVQQLVGFLVGRLAVVARDFHLHRIGIRRSLERLGALQDLLGHQHGIGAGALGDCQRDGRLAVDCTFRAVFRAGDRCDDPRRAVGGRGNVGHVAHIDRPPVTGGHQQVADLGRRIERLAHHKADLPLIAHFARRKGPVGTADLAGELLQRHAVEREPLRIGRNADRSRRCSPTR
jgi:hypothetical protein